MGSGFLEYLGGMKNLTLKEYDFMKKFIWTHSGEISSSEIYEEAGMPRGSVSGILFSVSEKGYLKKKQVGWHHIYTVLISELEYERALLRQQIKEATGKGSFEYLIAAFYGKDTLSEEQLGKINNLLKDFENALGDDK